jgi:hypothetical protein
MKIVRVNTDVRCRYRFVMRRYSCKITFILIRFVYGKDKRNMLDVIRTDSTVNFHCFWNLKLTNTIIKCLDLKINDSVIILTRADEILYRQWILARSTRC